MQVYNHKEVLGDYTRYELTVVIEGVKHSVQHMIPNNAYSALKIEDAQALIESQLWQQLMHHIEHTLRKIAYERT